MAIPYFPVFEWRWRIYSRKEKNITVQKIFFNCLIIQIKGEALTTGLQYIHIPHHHKLTLEYSKVKLPFIETKIQGWKSGTFPFSFLLISTLVSRLPNVLVLYSHVPFKWYTSFECHLVFINKILDQCIGSSDIIFAERTSCFCPKPTADACTMKMVGTWKAIQFCSINIWTQADTTFRIIWMKR